MTLYQRLRRLALEILLAAGLVVMSVEIALWRSVGNAMIGAVIAIAAAGLLLVESEYLREGGER